MRFFSLFCMLALASVSFGQSSRQHINFDEDWKFHLGHATEPHRDFGYGITNILAKTGDAARIGLYGFGAAAHIVAQLAQHQGRRVFAFTRPGDVAAQQFAKSSGAVWAGDSNASPPEELDAAIIFAPVGELVPRALKAVARGGVVVCGGIHMSDIPAFPYELLWQERTVCSVANLTRRDGAEFLALAPRVPVRTEVRTFPLADANETLAQLRTGRLQGAAVLIMTEAS